MKVRMLVPILLLGSMLAACAGRQPTAVLQNTPTPQPTAAIQVQPTAQPTAGAREQPTLRPTAPSLEPTRPADDVDLGWATDLSKLQSYRGAYSWTWSETKNGKTETAFWETHEEYSKADAARHIFWSSSEGSVEMIQLGQYTYVNSDGEWMSMLSTESDALVSSPFISSPLVMIAGGRGRLVERGVSVNGVLADHYVLSESFPGIFPSFGVADKAQADIFVAQQWQVVVQYVAHYEGKQLTITGGTNGVLDVTFDLTDINQPVTIVAPEGVAPPLPADIPILEGATQLTAMQGFVSFKTTRSVDEVTAFYNQAMVQKGWTAGPLTAGVLSFSKGQRQASVMIQAEGGQTSVIIMASQ